MTSVLAVLSAAHLAFYATSATIIPIFLLAIAVQSRTRRIFWFLLSDLGRVGAKITEPLAYILVVIMAAGEFVALKALYDDTWNSGHDPSIVFGAVCVGGLLVFLGTVDAVFAQLREAEDAKSGDDAKPDQPPEQPEPQVDGAAAPSDPDP